MLLLTLRIALISFPLSSYPGNRKEIINENGFLNRQGRRKLKKGEDYVMLLLETVDKGNEFYIMTLCDVTRHKCDKR